MANSTDITRAVLVIAATAGVIVINWLAGIGRINGVTPEAVSNAYQTIITPAGYAFSIWGLIYLGMIVFSIYQALPKNLERFRSIRTVYIFSCLLNCAWIYAWHSNRVIICLGIITALLATLLYINLKLRNVETYADYWTTSAPFSIYFGWVTAATIVNFAIAMSSLGFTVNGPGATAFGMICIFAGAAIAVAVRIKMTNYLHPLAVAWALTAIGVKQSGQTLVVAAAAVGTIACLISTCSFVMNLNSSISPRNE